MRTMLSQASFNGYTLWEGYNQHDAAPLALLASGFVNPSENPKTGPMIQVSLMRSDISPHAAVNSGRDESVCNSCELRPYLVREFSKKFGIKSGSKPPQCYVKTERSINQSWKLFKAGRYPLSLCNETLLAGKVVRFGAYGNMSNVPENDLAPCFEVTKSHTCYEHNWGASHSQWLRRWAMASVSTLEGKIHANDLGWRTFRVIRGEGELASDEVICPAGRITSSGRKVTCYDCGLCGGLSTPAKNIAIIDHGPTSPDRVIKQQAGRNARRFSLPTI